MRTMKRLRVVLAACGRSRAAFYADIKAGVWPPPVAIGGRSVAWPDDEVDAVIAARISGKSAEEIRDLVKRLVAARCASV